jgi:CelD/BcsL family acetyltransferase involved in cellulose biosynthesis
MSIARARNGVRLAVISEDGGIVGFLAFSSVGRRFARPVAPGISDLEAAVHHPAYVIDLAEVITRAGLIGWSFDHLVSFQAPADQAVSPSLSWVVDLTTSDTACAGSGSNMRPHHLVECARHLRRLNRAHPPVEFRFATDTEPALTRLLELKREQCVRQGWRDVLAVPWIVQVVRELADERSEALTGVTSALLSGGEIVSVEFGIRSAEVYASWIHAYDLRYSRHSPGSLLWYHLFPRLAEVGVRTVDLGTGLTEAKRRFSTGSVEIAQGFVASRGTLGACALAVANVATFGRRRAAAVESNARRAVRSIRRRGYGIRESLAQAGRDIPVTGAER